MRMRITVRDENITHIIDPRDIRDGISFALDMEGIESPCEVSVLITDDKRIKELNREHRGVNSATDVLSFPMNELSPGDYRELKLSKGDNYILLGDIVISAERAAAQAKEYGNTIARETAYLTVHSTLHLLGYDHTDEGEKKKLMRAKEKEIMSRLGYDTGIIDSIIKTYE